MRVGILTGGGDCPGLNPALRGAVLRGLDFGFEMIGILEGWKGLLELQTTPLTLKDVEEIISLGGTILGSSRTNPFKKEEDAQRCMENFRKLELDALIAIGGDDTLGVALQLYRKGFHTVGVPKTMDNDLSGTDYTFGFDSAVSVAVDAIDRLRDTAKSHRRIIVVEVMGRYAGWVALYSAVAGGADWVLIPEVPTDIEAMCDHLKKVYSRKRYGLVVASESIDLGREVGEEARRDQFGHIILAEREVGPTVAKIIEEKTGIETRSSVLGHIVRGGSPTPFDRILATRVGMKAAEMVQQGEWGKMAALRGLEVVAVPLEEAVGINKKVPREWYESFRPLFK